MIPRRKDVDTARFVRQVRDKLQLTQDELGVILQVSLFAVSRWERGVNVPNRRAWAQLWQLWENAHRERNA